MTMPKVDAPADINKTLHEYFDKRYLPKHGWNFDNLGDIWMVIEREVQDTDVTASYGVGWNAMVGQHIGYISSQRGRFEGDHDEPARALALALWLWLRSADSARGNDA